MRDEFLDGLEDDVIEAVRTLEKERYYAFSWPIMELIRQAKHYQRIAESLLAGTTSLPLADNQAEFNRAANERDWFRYPEQSKPRPVSNLALPEADEG